MSAVAARDVHERDPGLWPAHEAELRAYFAAHRPPAPGDRSNFGAMSTRLGLARNRRSTEQPTRGTPWTEILECRGANAGANFDGEDAMVAYVDARRRFRRVCDNLSRVSARHREVLEAFYGCESRTEHALGALAGVASLTDTALKRNRARAARGVHEPVEVTVRRLAAATTLEARAALEQIRQEAKAHLQEARGSYARVRA